MEAKPCAQCGAQIDAGARFCMSCGADVSGEQGLVATKVVASRTIPSEARRENLLERLRSAALGEYEVFAELGAGGMATVFLAHDIQLDRKVAIKVMSPSLLTGVGMVERFKLEAKTAASLSHPHIIPIYAVRETDELLFFVMKFVDGRPLDSIVRAVGPLPIAMVETVLAKVGEALGYAHRNGVIHRDIKPANIMIDVEGLPVVTDFGIAKVSDTQGLTMTGATVGTPTYMSPEQCSAGQITGASDQYSLGVVAYEMLSSKPPFDAETAISVMYKHCHEVPPHIGEVRPDCPDELADSVMRMLAKDPAERWESLERAVSGSGFRGLAYGHPVRTQMIDLARQGENREVLRRISTPRSPTPVVRAGSNLAPAPRSGSDAATVKLKSAQRDSIAAPVKQSKSQVQRGRWLMAAVAVVVLVAAGVRLVVGTRAEPPQSEVTEQSPVLPAVTSALIPEQAELAVGDTVHVVADVRDEMGNVVTDDELVWTSDRPSVAAVSAVGTVTALAEGIAMITARGGDGVATARITVTGAVPESVRATQQVPSAARRVAAPPAAVASVEIREAPAAIIVGEAAQLRSLVRTERGSAVTDRTVTWASSNPAVARVSAAGVVSALAPGSVIITASSAGKSGTVAIQVRAEQVARVTVSPPLLDAMEVGATARLSVQAWSTNNTELVGRAVTWTSADARVATVTQDGVVRAVGPGSTEIRGVVDDHTGAVTVSVAAEAAAELQPAASRAAIAAVIDEYGRAIESRDIQRIRQVFPDISPEQERQFLDSFEIMRDLAVSLRLGRLEIDGDVARAAVSGTYEFHNTVSRKDERTAVSFQITLNHEAGAWRIVDTR